MMMDKAASIQSIRKAIDQYPEHSLETGGWLPGLEPINVTVCPICDVSLPEQVRPVKGHETSGTKIATMRQRYYAHIYDCARYEAMSTFWPDFPGQVR